MAEPPSDPPKPLAKPPPLKPPDAGGLKSLSDDLAKGFEIAPGAPVRSIDAAGQVERSDIVPPRLERGPSSMGMMLDLPEEGGRLELADRPSAPPPQAAVAPVRGPGFAARRRATSGRKTLLLSIGAILGLTVIFLLVVSHRAKHGLTEAATGVPLSVDSEPAGAAIFVDGHETGQKTPATLASWDWLMPHQVELRLPGRATFQQLVPEGPHPLPLRAILAPVAFLDLQTNPAGADVRRGDYKIGTTPGHFELMAGGKNVLTIILPGHLTANIEVAATPGEVLTRAVALVPAGTLNLDSDPTGVRAEIDGHPAGETPLQIDLEAGRPHQLRLTASGLTAEERKVSLAAGKTTSLNVLLGDRLDRELRAQIAVTDRRIRSARAEIHRLENPHQSSEFFQTMARTRRQTKLEEEVDALEAKSERLQGALESHRSVLEDLVEKSAAPPEAAQRLPPPSP